MVLRVNQKYSQGGWGMEPEKIIIVINVMVFILWGVILLIRRKLMVSKILISILGSFLTIYSFTSISDMFPPIVVFLIILSFGILIVLLGRGEYIVYGVNTNTISDILRDVLKEERISYEEKESLFKLKDYDDKTIGYKKSSDTVDIDLNDIRKLQIYDIIRDEIKIRIQDIESSLFPKSGIIYVLLGISLLVFIEYLEKII